MQLVPIFLLCIMPAISAAMDDPHKKPLAISTSCTFEELILLQHETREAETIKNFPALFAPDRPYTSANLTELLQHAMVRNDLKKVKECLEKIAVRKKELAQNLTDEKLHKAIISFGLEGVHAQRMSLTDLCGSPIIVEATLARREFKGKLVVGLCAILLNPHRLKAKRMVNKKNGEKYLDDMAKINELIWQAYLPHEIMQEIPATREDKKSKEADTKKL